MEKIFSGISNTAANSSNITITQILMTIVICFLLQMIIGYTYAKTYRGKEYIFSFLHTLAIIGIVTSVIILIIGSNVARAFGLAGSLSVIRFRTAMKDPKDIAFVLFSMATGLACGGGYFLPAGVSVITISFLIYVLTKFNYGMNVKVERTLKITISENLNYQGLFDDVFEKYVEEFSLLRVKTINLGTMIELRYSINQKETCDEKQFIDDIRVKNGNLPVVLVLKE